MKNSDLLIGIDIGGTNTDGVLLDPTRINDEDRGILSYNKSITTKDISLGIVSSIEKLFVDASSIKKTDIRSITIGTTHFINAVIEQDRSRLEKIAVLRLCGPYTKGSPPYVDFPSGLTEIINGYVGYVDGGHRVDGQIIRPLDEKSILEHCEEIKKRGIKSIAVIGIFSIINKAHELECLKIINDFFQGDVDVVLSNEVSGIGYIERENITILNTAIIKFAKYFINSLIRSVRGIGLKCPILLTQNDGTVLTTNEAMKLPIRTFSSGATNSMRGASFLCNKYDTLKNKNIAIIDVGGTTSDIGILLPNGFPRQSSSYSTVGGVRMNFSMPQVESIGIGGGSIVRIDDSTDKLSIGPDSVGADIISRSLIFGGDTVTISDMVMAINHEGEKGGDVKIGDPSKAFGKFNDNVKGNFSKLLKKKISLVVDKMKTSPEPIPVILVGGGSFIFDENDSLEGVSQLIRPPFYSIANAIGAAMGKLSFASQKIVHVIDQQEKQKILDDLIAEAKNQIISRGAVGSTVEVIDLVNDPIPYVDNTYSFSVKVVGDIDYSRISSAYDDVDQDESEAKDEDHREIIKDSAVKQEEVVSIDHETYVPHINSKKEWIISEIDLEYFNIGTYILGCGGGGNPYPHYLELRTMVRNGGIIRVISLDDIYSHMDKDSNTVSVGHAGSPTVSHEQLTGPELEDAIKNLNRLVKYPINGVIALEIGGGNGFQGLSVGSSSKLNVPVVDCDLMGRAYPTHWQTLPVVYNDGPFFTPSAVSDGNGNDFIITGTQTDLIMERILRTSLSEIGCSVGVVNPPMNPEQLLSQTVHNSLSMAWRLGKAVMITRQKMELDKLPENILRACGGSETGKLLFQGKIVGVEKRLFRGHVYGEVIIENDQKDKLTIPFKNENIVAKLVKNGSNEEEIICSVPDLIAVCEIDTGNAVGTPDYRYGLMVFVLGIAPSNLWTDCEKGLEVGGPKAFGPVFENIEYKAIGRYIKPESVIGEYYES